MKKLIVKYWGLVLVVVLLCSLFVASAPASAANYFMFNSFQLPTGLAGDTTLAPTAGFGVVDMAISGSTIYASCTDTIGNDFIYKSTDGGTIWNNLSANASISTVAFAPVATGTWNHIAVAPDDPNVVVVVDTQPNPDVVYLTTSGGAIFTALGALTAGAYVNTVTISPTNGFTRYITVGGNTGNSAAPAQGTALGYLVTWTSGAASPAWTAPGIAATAFNPGVLLSGPIPAGATGNVTLDNINGVAFSANFLADQTLLVVTSSISTTAARRGECTLHIFSYNTNKWDGQVDVSFPRVLKSVALGNQFNAVASADIALDANFFLADEAAQIGFIGASITTNATTQSGGVFRIGTYTVAGGVSNMTQIMTGTAISTVAWDGTNLMAVQSASSTIWRSSTALGVLPAFMQNTTLKSPSTGVVNRVLFTDTVGLAGATGAGLNPGLAKTADLGKSWNGYKFQDKASFATITDFWTSPDGAVKYFCTDMAASSQVWRMDGAVTQRVMINNVAPAGAVWLVRADIDNPANVFIGRRAGTTMFKSTDSGETVWTARSSSMNIQDFAVQDANTVYVGVAGTAFMVKSTNGAFTWGFPTTVPTVNNGGGTIYSLNLISDDNMVIGFSAGGVAYTNDGGATYNAVGGIGNLVAGNTVVTADSLAAGGNIYAISSHAAVAAVNSQVCKWTIGASFMWTSGVQTISAAPNQLGIALANGVLYVLDNAGAGVTRVLDPINVFAVGEFTAGSIGTYNLVENTLMPVVAGTTSTVYAINTVGGTLDAYSDFLTASTTTPKPIYPLTGTKIDVNSISGVVAVFTFQWSSPGIVTFPNPAYKYDVQVYLDEAGTVLVGGTIAAGVPAAATIAPTVSIASNVLGGAAVPLTATPGETYYWRVRTTATWPAQSPWSEMESFTVKQLTAVVPTLASPANGSTVTAGTIPAFSWSPISGAATYSFQVSTDPSFATTIYSTTTTSAGAQVPSSVTLTAGTTYFWRVKALAPTEGEWSTVGNFVIAKPVVVTTTPPAPVVTPTITVQLPPTTTTTIVIPPNTTTTTEVNPSYIWAIIIIGAVLVIAVIVLIVRTRRSV
jgi:uncharacterized integral membrane protein